MIKYIANGTERVKWGDTLCVGRFDFTEINSLYTINSVKSGTLPPFITLTNGILLSDSDSQVKGRWVVVFDATDKEANTPIELQIDFRCHEFFPTVITPDINTPGGRYLQEYGFIQGRGNSRVWRSEYSSKSQVQRNVSYWELSYDTTGSEDLGGEPNPSIQSYSGIATGTFRSNKTVYVVPLIQNSVLAAYRYEVQLQLFPSNNGDVVVDWGDGTIETFPGQGFIYPKHNYSTNEGFRGTFFITIENHIWVRLTSTNNQAWFCLQVADSQTGWIPNRYTPSHLVLPDSVTGCVAISGSSYFSFDFNCLFDDWNGGDRDITCLFAGDFNFDTGEVEDNTAVTGTVRWNEGVNFKHPFFAFSGCKNLTNYESLPKWMREQRFGYNDDELPIEFRVNGLTNYSVTTTKGVGTSIYLDFQVDDYTNVWIPTFVSIKGLPEGLSWDSKEQIISGKPSKFGKYSCEVSAAIIPFGRLSDGGTNEMIKRSFTITVLDTIRTGDSGIMLGDIFYKTQSKPEEDV